MGNDISSMNPGVAAATQVAAKPEAAEKSAPEATEPSPEPVKVDKLEVPEIDHTEQIERLERIVDQLNESLRELGRNLDFAVDQRLNRYVVTVENKESGEVIRVIPGEEALRMAHRIEDLKGIIFNEDV